MDQFDVIIIGAGPAGYVCAIRCAQLGLKTACVDNWQDENNKPRPGGTCLNAGCIPSKVLLESSEYYYQLLHQAADHGIKTGKVSIDINIMMQRKHKIVHQLTSGIQQLFKANGVSMITGQGRLLANKVVQVKQHKKTHLLQAEHIVLASGSRSMQIPSAPLDGEQIVDSRGALSFTRAPEKLVVIGAGVIGLELGSVWRRLGSKVILLEAQEQFLSMVDRQIAAQALTYFKKCGLDIRLSSRLTASDIVKKGRKREVKLTYQQNGETGHLLADKVLVAVGRQPNTQHLFADEVDLLLDERGRIHVDKYCRTNLPGIYAIGDVVRGPMLAHKGSEEGMAVAQTIAGTPSVINTDVIPSVVYTLPEIAWVGKTEQQLQTEGIAYQSGVFPFSANGRAKAMQAEQGMVKILAQAQTDQILGVHIIGDGASELIAQAVTGMEFSASAEDIARTIFAHPTLSEAIHEAAMAVDNRAIHKINN